MDTPATNRPSGALEPELSPMSKKVRHFEKYSRKGGRWSWKRPSYERDVVNLVKTERRIEEGIASALTEVDAVEAGLRYFDELIIPQNKHVGIQQQLISSNGQDESNGVDTRKASRDGPGSRSKGPRAQGGRSRDEGRAGFTRSEGAKLRDYVAAKKNVVGVGNSIMTSSDRAVSECVDLKLTLKQRLDNYDRQRGINVTALKDEEKSEAQLVSFKQQNNHEMKAKHSKRSGGGTIGSNVEGGNQGGMIAPCCEGGATDAGSVGGILARSLGNAGTRRRRRMTEGGGKGRSIPGSNQDKEVSAPQSRWRSWNEPPPRALLTAEEIRSASAAKTTDERRRQPPPPEVIAEIIPPFRSRRRFRTPSGNSNASDEKGKPTEHAAAGVSLESGEGEKRRDGCNGEGLVSTTTAAPSSSRRTAAGGVPLVPRVATLATPPATEKNKTEATKKGKDFDPDQLECVRRHEASIAEKERMVHSIREEAEKRTFFRARPLPAFLDGDGAVPWSVGDLTSKGCGDARGKGGKSGRGSAAGTGLGEAGTRPELLAALEQDEEAQALVEKIRKINPRADIASIVLQSTPRTPLSLPLTSRINNGGGRVTRPFFSQGGVLTPAGNATHTATTAATGLSWSKNNTASRPLMSVGVSDQSTPGLKSEHKSPQSVVRVDGSDARERSEGRAEESHVTRVSGICERKPEDGQERGMLGTGDQQVRHHMATGASASATSGPASAPENDGEDSGDPRCVTESRRRSLMGRMLESGMLERQKEWAKARSKKVLESRRQVEAAKEQEGKGDALVAGLSGRSWSKAKTEHLRSLERQRKEEETREEIREARRRASELRAERERESAERRATEIADTLAAAADAVGAGTGRESRTAPNSRGGGGRRRLRRPPPPRRARSHAGDEGHVNRTGDGGGIVSMTANERRQKTEGETSPDGGNHVTPVVATEAKNDLSEDSFYRVAVEKIMEKERLGVASHGLLGGSGSGGGGGDGGDGGKSGAGSSGRRRTSCSGRSHDRSRKGAAAGPLLFHLPRGAAAGRRTRTKSGAPMHQSQARGANGTPNSTVGRRRSWEIQTSRTSERHAVTPPTLSADRALARTSSLLSLYEAQSVEHVAGIRRDNSGPYLDDDDALGPSRDHTSAGWPGGEAQDRLTLAGQEQLSVLVATSGAEKFTPSGGAAGAMDYPWSDERRASGSRGSGGGARHIVEGGTRLDAAAATVSGSPRWNDVLNIGQQLDQARGTSANEGEEHPRRRRGGDVGGGAVTRLGGRFDLWNESDDEVSVTEADRHEHHTNLERRNEHHASGSNSQACEGAGALDSGDDGGHAMDSFLMPAQGTGFPVTAQAGGFFDAATSSADKGRLKVITVMFDRSKFNEQEAHRWWLANGARIVNISDRG
ncbi:expressed unknown protein [Ectocarpus siliculosus]|uniref:BRX domain-containing protein n=1 Tax=Ectocarpus siliculosus TaxID=2880 RepID=D7FKC8_ECTSI|nr:expressed unknown protein [Ectocarpus siliculosus]|eukprot:CBJ29331.1 expressed unknown protein [Ectocarpus siliculosus]